MRKPAPFINHSGEACFFMECRPPTLGRGTGHFWKDCPPPCPNGRRMKCFEDLVTGAVERTPVPSNDG